ncbi:MAG: dioxygenase, partial [Bdellovibrionales bacterium]|nr:dioxygenase [Bdellovibrionales bacterium]
DLKKPLEYHFELGKKLKELRTQGVLIIGSGNVVHNISQVKWDDNSTPYDWAVEFDQWIEKKSQERDFQALVHEARNTEAGRLAIPTLEHYLPLLYILGAADKKDELTFDIKGIQNGSMSMRSLRFG